MAKYRIKERKFSSNVIEEQINEKWQVCLVPTFNKKLGDELCQTVFKLLTDGQKDNS